MPAHYARALCPRAMPARYARAQSSPDPGLAQARAQEAAKPKVQLNFLWAISETCQAPTQKNA